MSHSDIHRFMLQSFSNLGKIKKTDAEKLLQASCRNFNDSSSNITLDSVVRKINEKILAFDQQIFEIKYEIDDNNYLVFANTIETGMNKMQLVYMENELEFFRILIESIAQSEAFRCSSMIALNLSIRVTSKHLNRTQAESLMDTWEEMGYFVQNDNDYCFGPKLIVEFQNYLRNNFPDNVKICNLCKKLVFYGTKCTKCEHHLHTDCLKKYLIGKSNCPACKEEWPASSLPQ